jgi:hypothetical protein
MLIYTFLQVYSVVINSFLFSNSLNLGYSNILVILVSFGFLSYLQFSLSMYGALSCDLIYCCNIKLTEFLINVVIFSVIC